MPLIINQGKQDVSKDLVKYDPITAKNVLVSVISIKLADNIPNTIYLKMQVMEGEFKKRIIDDKVSFDPTSPLSWRYRAARKAVGVPYSETEPMNIDIEAVFLNKALRVDLAPRVGKDKEGNEKTFQSVNYKPLQMTVATSNAITNTKPITSTPTPTVAETKPAAESSWENDDEDLPF